MTLPVLLVIDDLFGRSLKGRSNQDRQNLCTALGLVDVTLPGRVDPEGRSSDCWAFAAFVRGQQPLEAGLGDVIENDLEGTLDIVGHGWVDDVTGVTHPWSMVLLDLSFLTGPITDRSNRRMSGMPEGRPSDDNPGSYFGLVLLEAIHQRFSDTPVFMLSSKQREEVSLEFSERGALGFIARHAIDGRELLQDAVRTHGLLPDPAGNLIGYSTPILLALREARRAAKHRDSLLIRGERGVGKELLARYVHEASQGGGGHGERPYFPVNAAALTPSLFAAELFGVEPRVASGVDAKVGLIERAHGGDLFLDEIADMPTEVQAGILRVLQERQVVRVGGHQTKQVDVRFLSATNANLDDPKQGFRSDLLDRLKAGGTLSLPPLRERREDIPLLVEKFLREAESRRLGALAREVSPDALTLLATHDWPGNVRELRSVVFDAVTRFPDVEHLVPGHLRVGQPGYGSVAATRKPSPDDRQESGGSKHSDSSFSQLLQSLAAADFAPTASKDWAGRLAELQREQQRVSARLLRAALEATKRRTPEHPEGTLQVHPALKLLTGDARLTASQAADTLKRLLGPIEEELEGDLRSAYQIALRLRPKSASVSRTATVDSA